MSIVAKPPFSWGEWIGGFVIALFVCAIGNVVLIFISLNHGVVFGAVAGAATGVVFAILGNSWRRRGSLGLGMMTGACIMALLGGICGGQAAIGG